MKTLAVCFLTVAAWVDLSLAADNPARKLTYEKDDHVWIANLDGSSRKKIAEGQSPEFSPDGAKLAYNTDKDMGQTAQRQIAVFDIASGQTTILKDVPSKNCMEVRWSPEGKRLLFEFYENNQRNLGVVNADGAGFIDLQKSEPKHKDYWSETWAADGKSIFVQDMKNLYLLDLNDKVLKQWEIEKLFPHGGMSGGMSGGARMDASADGKTLLADVDMDEPSRKGWAGPPASIWTLDLATEKATRLTPKDLYAWDCHWLDYPNSILFLTQIHEDTQSIYRMTTTGQGQDKKLLVKDARGPGTSR